MQFNPALIAQILAGRKRQTRRPINGVNYYFDEQGNPNATDSPYCDKVSKIVSVTNERGHLRFEVGKSYAAQPGRGLPTALYATYPDGSLHYVPPDMGLAGLPPEAVLKPLRIRVTAIRREDCRQISAADARAEGFEDQLGFLLTWINFYDKPFLKSLESTVNVAWHGGRPNGKESLDVFMTNLERRPAARYDCFALTFCVEE